MPSSRILVIAPSTDLRRSLSFALEAEGYVVTTHAAVLGSDSGRGYDAVVLDYRAAKGERDQVLELCRSVPVVLLAGTPQPWLNEHVARVVQTPIRGESLAMAVREMVAT